MAQNPGRTPAEASEFDRLELPDRSARGLLRHFGPGIILMMTGIGTSHLVTAPTAGGRFAYALLWCLPVAYIFKYYGFEMAFRFTNATGKSLIEAYATARGKWPLWYVLVTTLIQCAIGQAGRLIAAAAVVYYVASEVMGWPVTLTGAAVGLGVVSVGILLMGRYKAVENSAQDPRGHHGGVHAGRLLLPARPLLRDGHLLPGRDPRRLLAGHRRLPGPPAHRHGCLAAGLGVGEGQEGRDEQDPRPHGGAGDRAPVQPLLAAPARPDRSHRSPPRARTGVLPALVPDRPLGTSASGTWCRS